jgi:hypothetical protein
MEKTEIVISAALIAPALRRSAGQSGAITGKAKIHLNMWLKGSKFYGVHA